MEETAALVVAILSGMAALIGLSFVKDRRERALLTKLFFTAFGVRLLFTFVFYVSGLVHNLGGMDDTIWIGMWGRSRSWGVTGPDSLWTVYAPDNLQANAGWAYAGSWFYYLLNMRSQLALACLNCFGNALVVLVIYKSSREFFEEKASTFVAWIAVFMPGFLIWSALTVKETWLILFEISAFYAVWRISRRRNLPSAIPYVLSLLSLLLLVGVTLGFRFYVAYFLVVGIVITLMCCRARRPLHAAGIGLLAVVLLYSLLGAVNVIQFDLLSVTQTRINEIGEFRKNVSDVNQAGANSAIRFDFDTTTPGGALMMLGIGSVYLLLSPFPWQIRSLGEAAALPDVLLWWWLVFVLILPGIGYAWRRNQAVVLSVAGFALPLFLFYAFMFGNVGLAYRQRAQLMPFLLVLAAAGQEKRLQKKQRSRAKRPLRPSARFAGQPSPSPVFRYKA